MLLFLTIFIRVAECPPVLKELFIGFNVHVLHVCHEDLSVCVCVCHLSVFTLNEDLIILFLFIPILSLSAALLGTDLKSIAYFVKGSSKDRWMKRSRY